MSENSKLRIDHGPLDPHDRAGAPDDINRIDEAESQMRKALGLLGDAPRHHRPEPERQEPQTRSGSGGSLGGFGGGLHRRRFVQDGDVPVTVLRRDGGHEPAPHRGGVPAPTSNRLQRTESALTAETAARDKAERALHESQALARDLQTKIGHAELARNEALEGQRREREASARIRLENDGLRQVIATLREELDQAAKALDGAVKGLEEERRTRKAAESAQKTAEAALEDAERLIHTLSEAEVEAEADAPIRTRRASEPKAPRVATVMPDKAASRRGETEPEPVKWWLNAAPVAKRR